MPPPGTLAELSTERPGLPFGTARSFRRDGRCLRAGYPRGAMLL